MSNFQFFSNQFNQFFENANKAEKYLNTDAEACAIFCRKALEEQILWMFETDRKLEVAHEEDNLNSLMHKPGFVKLVGNELFRDLNLIRKFGNYAIHSNNKKITQKQAYTAIINLHAFGQWLVNHYTEASIPQTFFNTAFLAQATIAELPEVLSLVADDKAIYGTVVKEYHSPSEQLTRELYIDLLLLEAGWIFNTPAIQTEYLLKHSNGGLDRADYVLFGEDGKALAVIEAKRTTVDGREKGLQQGLRYANALEKEFGTRPIIFTSNGFEHWIWDDLQYPYRNVQGFYSKDELETLVNRRILQRPLTQQAVNTDIAGRYFQIEAIKRAKEQLELSNRDLLFIMATGSGKTRTAAGFVDVLTKANWAKRILFLADRTSLVSQAQRAFGEYLPQLTSVNLTKDKESDQVRMVFSTYQTLINCIDSEFVQGKRKYTPGYFDLVIFDEVHRSIYKKYQAIFNYFDAIRLGLTATPKAEMHRDTYQLFKLETGNPTFAYELNQAVDDKFLVPPKAMSVPLKFPREGIKYAELSAEDKLKYEEEFASSEEEMPEEVDSGALHQWLFNEDTVNKVLVNLMDNGLKVNDEDILGKSIIFAKNLDHSRFIEECFNKLYPHLKGHYLQVITYKSDQPDQLIEEFKKGDKLPRIAVSVDMLDTGIDIPEVLNLVFFKPVKSSSKYWQMIGRGTRLSPDIFGPGEDKEYFLVFDYCGNFEFFDENPEGVEPSLTLSISQRIFLLKIKLASLLENFVEDDDMNAVRQKLLNELHVLVSSLDQNSFVNRQELRSIIAWCDRNYWNNLSEQKINNLQKKISHLIVNDDPNIDAKRFDVISYQLMEAFVTSDPSMVNHIIRVKGIASDLLKQTTIPHVAQKQDLLKDLLKDTFWQNVDIIKLESVREEIRDLVKFIEKEKRNKIYLNIKDELTGEIKEFHIVKPFGGLESYHRKVAAFIRQHKDYIVINKIRNNLPVSFEELEQVRTLLFSEDPETASHLDEVLAGKSFVEFIRSLIGLDVGAAKASFAEFINRPEITADQITFMNTLIDCLTQNGKVDKSMLFERPFTDINHQGVIGVFPEDDAKKIIQILEKMNASTLTA